MQIAKNKHWWRGIARWPLTLVPLLALGVAACAQSQTGPTASHQLAIKALPSQPLTFYEGEATLEPFTPFLAQLGPNNSILTFGFAQNEGAFYITTYNSANWQETAISNGFGPTDPQWACDQSPENSTTFSRDVTMMVRACADGSLTVFNLPGAVALFHITGSPDDVSLAARSPVAVFAPDGKTLAVTDDGPGGPGQDITLLGTAKWQSIRTISLNTPLLSRPAWSPDGTAIAVVDLAGKLHIINAASGQDVATASLPQFALGSAATDPAGPAPQWSPDGTALYVTTPGTKGTVMSVWTFHSGTLAAGAVATLVDTPNAAEPQLSPDGTYLFVHTATNHGQIFTTTDLKQIGDFALPGTLTIWAAAQRLASFTLQATVVPLQVG